VKLADTDIVDLLVGARRDRVSAGAYSPKGLWHVTLRDDVQSAAGNMVALHELMHGYLNSKTAYGGLLLIIGSLSQSESATDDSLHRVARLVQAARTTHEIVATSWGVWGVDGDPDTLLHPYPEYNTYLTLAQAITPRWADRAWSKRLAIFTVARVCMQVPVIERALEVGLSTFSVDDVDEAWRPDYRLRALLDSFSPEAWRSLEDEAALRFGNTVARGEVDAGEVDSDEPWRRFQEWFYEQMSKRLSELDLPVLELDGHIELVARMRDAARSAFPSVAFPGIAPADSLDEQLNYFFGERFTLRDEPYPAVVHASAPLPFYIPEAPGKAHVFLSFRPLARVLSQFQMSPLERQFLGQLADERTVSATIRMSRHEHGRRVVEMWPVSTPDLLDQLSVVLENRPLVVSVATSVLGDPQWRATWLPALQAFPHLALTALFDTPPHLALRDWHEAGFGLRWVACQPMFRERAPFILSVCLPDGRDSFPHFAVSSRYPARGILGYAETYWPAQEPVQLSDTVSAAAELALIHLAFEEPWFDFSGARDLMSARGSLDNPAS
jgi:hypothetical protein